jgi:hypothetical protein
MPALSLFDDLPPAIPDCATTNEGHAWKDTVTTWPGETFERLTRTCTRCGQVRGRA